MNADENKIRKKLYDGWASITEWFSQILAEDENFETVGKKLDQLLIQGRPFLTPIKSFAAEYRSTLDDCKCFNAWLFGQLINMRLRGNLKILHKKFFHIQVKLLQHLRDYDLLIYQDVFDRYIRLLVEVCKTLELENQKDEEEQLVLVFKWSSEFYLNQSVYLPQIEHHIHGHSLFIECVNFLISLFISLQHELSVDFCSQVSSVLWECALALLHSRRRRIQFVNIQAYRFVAYLLVDYHSSNYEFPRFDTVITVLLQHIMLDISVLCRTGEVVNDEDFCALLNTVTDLLDLNLVCFDYSYPQMLYSLLLQRNPKISNLVQDAMLKFFSKLLHTNDLISVSDFVEKENITCSSVANINVLVVVLEHLLKDNLRYYLWNRGYCTGDKTAINLYQVNKHWRYLLDLVVESLSVPLKRASSNHIILPNYVNDFQTVLSVSQLAMNVKRELALEHKEIEIFFFANERLGSIVDTSEKLFIADGSKGTLLIFMKFVSDLLSFNEAKHYNERILRQLMAFFTASWLPTLLTTDDPFPLPESIRDKYFSCVDAEIKDFCIVSLMTRVHRFQFATWREEFFYEIVTRRSVEILQSLPILIHSLNDFELEKFVSAVNTHGHTVLDRRKSSSRNEALNALSSHIRILVCSADNEHSSIVWSKGKYRVLCTLCDDRSSNSVDEPVLNVRNTSRRTFLYELVVRIFDCSEEAKHNVLFAAVDLFRHIPKTIDLLNLLQPCFRSSDANVRKKIIEITPYLIFRAPSAVENAFSASPVTLLFCPTTFENFMKHLEAVALSALADDEREMQYLCLNAVVRISCSKISSEETLLSCVGLLLIFMLNASSAYPTLAERSLKQIAIAHNFQTDDQIFMKYRDDIFPLVAKILVINYRTYNVKLTDLICDYGSVFNESTINQVLRFLMPHIARDPELAVLLPELSSQCSIEVPRMLHSAFKHILPQVMLFEEAETTKQVIELISKETNTLIFDLLSRYVTKVLAQLFMHYEDQEEHVRWVLKEIRLLASSTSKSSSSSADHVSDLSVESFLESRFFGVLMKLENRLSTDTFCEKTRRQILSAFKSLIRFMSSAYVTSVRFKVLLTLRTITDLEKTNAPAHCIDIWDTFVRQLASNVLGPILSTIFISLLPFIETYRERINSIYRFLIIENRAVIGDDHILQLYFLPQKDCDEGIRAIIEESRMCLQKKRLEERLEWLLNATKHEVKEIKLHALRHLKAELASHRADVSRLILASDSVNRLVFQILDVLVDGFRNSDASVQVASGQCMGEFGAIDPSYIPNVVINENDSKKYNCYDLDSVEFVTQAFRLLCRGLQTTSKSANADAFAVAIQMLIKYYEVDQKEDNKYWCKLPERLREIIRPLQSTRYFLQDEVNAEVPHLVFSSGKYLTVQKWAYGWSNFLISLLCENSKVNGKDLKVRKIFTSCKMPMSCDLKCMMFFLPHILLHAILVSDDHNLTKIYEEMYSVIKHDCTGGNASSELSPDVNDGPTGTQLIISEELSVASNTDQEMGVICPKIIFNLLDVLHKKYRDIGAANNGRFNAHREQLKKFLGKFKKFQLAQKAFDRKEYMRSLLYLEEYLHEKSDVKNILEKEEQVLPFLVKIYFHLNDVDNVKGIFAKHSLKLHQLQNVIMLHEITDQFQDAAICYQQLLKTTVLDDEERALFYEKRAIQCYLAINQPELALRFVNSLSSAKTRPSFYDVECEALWNLSQFEKLDKLASCKDAAEDENWGVRIGQSLVYLLKGKQEHLEGELNRIRTTLTKLLHMSTAAMDGYRESYEHSVKLHILTEFEKIAALLFSIPGNARNVAVGQWKQRFHSVTRQEFDERLHKLQPTNRVLQQVLNVRQAMFTVATKRLTNCEKFAFVELFNEEIRRCWLKVIEMANRTRNFELAYSNIIAIDNYQVKGFFIEKAKYYWEKKEPQEALRTLSYGLEHHYPETRETANYSDEDLKFCSDAYILMGTYNDAIANSDCSVNVENFKMAAEIYPRSENTLVKLAQYQEKVISASGDMFTHPDMCVNIVKLYGRSLTYGCEFIYQSFSRMLNIWLDLAERHRKTREDVKNLAQQVAGRKHANSSTLDSKKQQSEELRSRVTEMTTEMSNLLMRVPKYYLLTAFSLIMSRLSHPSSQCFDVLQNMVVECIHAYPDQALWLFTSLCEPRTKNSESARELSGRARRILTHANLSSLHPMVEKYRNIFREFSDLCLGSKPNHISSGANSLTSLISTTSNLLITNTYSEILIPAQKFMTIVLPRSTANGSSVASKLPTTHNPFPETRVTIAKIRNEAHVYSSMQKPVRVTLVGTDGHEYPMIFKAMDDLRIDSRAMEFNAVVNMYLKRDAEARNRALVVRTYTVLPLYQTNGIIEFIPNLDTMRITCQRMRRYLGLPPTVSTAKQMRSDIANLKMKERFDRFDNLCEMYKPVLHKWYAMEFPNPSSWYTARQSYVRTLAVMSVVGYILGLGDRHNDNILIDRTNGDIVHVDFNALFNKGDTMPCPERVPFRLTHSMIKAMGLLGYDGGFRYACEIVNRIIRAHKDQLISVLNTFLYDPSDFLTEQSRNRKLANGVIEMTAEKLRDVEARMNGVVRKLGCAPSMPLSVEGQVSRLIEEATSKENLCQMFYGWAAFM